MPLSDGILSYMGDLHSLEFSNTYRIYESKLKGLRDVRYPDGSIHKVNQHGEDIRYVKLDFDPIRPNNHTHPTIYYFIEGVWMRFNNPNTQIIYDQRTHQVEIKRNPGSVAASITHRKAAIYSINRRQWMKDHGGLAV